MQLQHYGYLITSYRSSNKRYNRGCKELIQLNVNLSFRQQQIAFEMIDRFIASSESIGIDESQKIKSIRWDGFWQIINSLPKTLNLPIFMPLLSIHGMTSYYGAFFEVSFGDTRIEMRIGSRRDGTIFSSQTPLRPDIHY